MAGWDAAGVDDLDAIAVAGLVWHPGNASILYNLACAEAGAGRPDDALRRLGAAVERHAKYTGPAASDPDLDSIRGELGFP